MTATTTRNSRITLGPGDRVAIVAGSGRLPVDVAEGLAIQGHSPLVLAVQGEVDSSFDRFDVESIRLGAFGGLIGRLKRLGITHLVLAGGISRRPRLSEIKLGFSLLRHLPKAVAGLARGDDGLLSIVVRTLEEEGIKVVGAHQIVPDLLTPEGPIGAGRPQSGDWSDLTAAYKAARALGALDIGQGAVSIGGHVIAVEGIEGTDGLLERVRDMRGHGRLAGKGRGVLVKCAKPGQELRADLPAIGPKTVEMAHAAGLAGIGAEADHSLVLEGAEMVRLADELGIFVVGLRAGGPT
jgi:DUF1009 family protein